MKVIPNRAMMTVTTADSKYSRTQVLGGPTGSASPFRSRSRPFDRTGRALNASAFSVVSCFVVVAGSVIEFIVDWRGHAVKQRPRCAHLLQGGLSGSGFGRFDGLSLTTRRAAVPFQLDMEHAIVRWAERLDNRVLRGRLPRG